MASVIQFTPLYGASDTGPLCYLLELDDCKVLLDCGWDDNFNERDIEALARVVSDVDAVLISHPDIAHLGALPYAFGQLGLDCPIFSTQPVWRMGWMFMYDAWQRLNARMDFDLFSIDDVDAAFEKITSVTYSQECRLTGRGDGITVTPFQAGHTLGGAIWRIVKESEQIVYAVDINHRRERHLDGTVLETACPRPSVLITDVYNVLKHVPTRKERDAQLFDAIRDCLERGGNCLMPVPTAGRVLELLVYLHSRWVAARMDQKYSIAFLSHVAFNTIDFARTYLEWMSETCQKQFDQARESPFDLKCLHICQSIEELDRLKKPVLVLASNPFIDASFAEDLFIRWAPDKNNLIMLTMAPRVPCIASTLLQMPPPTSVEIVRRFRMPLEGDELREYMEKRKEQEATMAQEESESESDDDDEAEFDERVGAATTMFKRRLKLVSTYPMFGFKEVVHASDMYGEQIDFSDYVVPEINSLAEGGTAQPDGANEATAAALDEAGPISAVPTKAMTELVTVPIRCQIAFVDFEGRMDQNSIKNVIKRVQPRKTILVHGPDQGKELFMQFMESDLPASSTAVAPDNLQTSVISAEKNVFNIKLRDSLVKSLRFVKVDDYEVAYVDGRIIQSDESRHPVLEATGSAMDERPAVFLGGPRMADLKKAITGEGIDAEFISGVLVCGGGQVNIRKVNDQQVSIQGVIGSLYFKIRSIVYSQYTIL